MTNTAVMYRSHKDGLVNVDEMDEIHVRNVLKKLIKDELAPEGEVVSIAVDAVHASKALKSLEYALKHIKVMGSEHTEEGAKHWKGITKYLRDTQILLAQYTASTDATDDE